MKKIKEMFTTAEPNKVEWGVAIAAIILIFFTMYYQDNFGIFLTYFWDNNALLTGHSIGALGNHSLSYGITQQWICQIWILPVNILNLLCGLSCDSELAIWWYKACILFFYILSVREMGKIGRHLGFDETKIKWMNILFTTTVLVALPVFHIAQTDAIYMFFSLKGLYAWLENRHREFLLWFMLAIPCKWLAVFAFIPLVLLSEKRILYILRDVIVGVAIIPAQYIWIRIVSKLDQLIFAGVTGVERVTQIASAGADVSTAEAIGETGFNNFMSHFINKMLYFEFPAVRKGYTASILVIAFVLLFIWCYASSYKEKELAHTGIYASVIAMMIFFLFSSPSPYWIVVLYPYLFLMIFINEERFRINMLLEMLFTGSMFLLYVVDTYWVYGGPWNFKWLPVEKWFHLIPDGHLFDEGPSVAGYLYKLGIEWYMPIITGICLASAIGLIVVNRSRSIVSDGMSGSERRVYLHGCASLQSLFLLVWYIFCLYAISRY